LTSRPTALAMGTSLVVLAGIPPSPLFVSELMILLALVEAGLLPVAAIAALLLALGFLGMAHALLEALLGKPRRLRGRTTRTARAIGALAVGACLLLVPLAAGSFALPDGDLVRQSPGGLE
jgi:hydrogenase-4 component F